MAKVFLIKGSVDYESGAQDSQEGYIADNAIPEGPEFIPNALGLSDFPKQAERMVCFFSRRAAQEVANKFKKNWKDKGNGDTTFTMIFEVVEKIVPDKIMRRIMNKSYKFLYEQNK